METLPARINYFAKVSAVIDGTPTIQFMVCLSWFKHHVHKDVCGKPVTIWECDLCSIVPVDTIKCRTISLVDKFNNIFCLFLPYLLYSFPVFGQLIFQVTCT